MARWLGPFTIEDAVGVAFHQNGPIEFGIDWMLDDQQQLIGERAGVGGFEIDHPLAIEHGQLGTQTQSSRLFGSVAEIHHSAAEALVFAAHHLRRIGQADQQDRDAEEHAQGEDADDEPGPGFAIPGVDGVLGHVQRSVQFGLAGTKKRVSMT